MPCLYPKLAVQYAPGNQPKILKNRTRFLRDFVSHDKIAVFFNAFSVFDVPCNSCLQCRLSQSRNWAVRCQHELQMHPQGGIFLTLTYAPENLPSNRSLDKTVVPRFIADLRRWTGASLKYFHCGEYGDKLERPHYHVLIFGWRPSDAIKRPRRGLYDLYTSPTIEALWPYGFAPFGELTFESAAYTARYATKKITGRKAEDHYKGKQPEYATMSNRGGIGRSWLEKYFTEVYPSDAVLVNGHLVQPPRFYDKICEKRDPELFAQVKINRLAKYKDKPILTVDQLADLRRATQTKFDLMMRSIE